MPNSLKTSKDMDTFHGDMSEDEPTSAIVRDSTYQPKICHSRWFCNENVDDPKTSARYLLSQADYFYYQKKWDEAIRVYKKAIPENMDRNTSLLMRIILESVSRCYFHKGDIESALEWAVKLLNHSQSNEHKVVAHDLLSRIYNQAGKLSKEAEHLTFCLLRQPLNGYHWMRLGHSYVYKAREGSGEHLQIQRSEMVECDQLERISSTTVNCRNHIEQGMVWQNGDSSIAVVERLETGLEELQLQNLPSVNHSKTTFNSRLGKPIQSLNSEESDHNFVRIEKQSAILKASSQMENDRLESVDKVVNGNEHCLNLRDRRKEDGYTDKDASLVSQGEERVFGEEQGSASTEHVSSNGCATARDEESVMDPMKFALICYIRARMLFKPNVQSSASLCNIRYSKLLVEVEQSIQGLGFGEDFIMQVEDLCWKRQFGTGKGDDLEKTFNRMVSSENTLNSEFEKYWFTSLMNQAVCTAKE